MSKARIKIGQLCIGHNHAAEKMRAVRKFPDLFEVVGIAEPDREWREKRGGLDVYEGLRWMDADALLAMPELDAVLVECDVWNLTAAAQSCIDAGKHIHLDKPGGEDFDAFERLLCTAQSKERIVQMAYMYRYNSAVRYCQNAIRSGELGEVFGIDAMMSTEHPPEYREWLRHFPGGSMYIFGSHLIDLIVSMLGRPEQVYPFQRKTGFDAIEAFDNCLAVLEYRHGTSTVRTNSTEVNGFGRRQLVVCGSRGTIEVRPLEKPTEMTVSRSGMGGAYEDHRERIILPELSGRYDSQMQDFARLVRGEKKDPGSYAHDLMAHKILLKACGYEIDW